MPDLLLGGFRMRKTYVVEQRPREEEIVLLNAAHLCMQGEARVLHEIVAVHEYTTLRWQVELLQQAHNRCFSTAGVPHKRHRLPRLNHK